VGIVVNITVCGRKSGPSYVKLNAVFLTLAHIRASRGSHSNSDRELHIAITITNSSNHHLPNQLNISIRYNFCKLRCCMHGGSLILLFVVSSSGISQSFWSTKRASPLQDMHQTSNQTYVKTTQICAAETFAFDLFVISIPVLSGTYFWLSYERVEIEKCRIVYMIFIFAIILYYARSSTYTKVKNMHLII